MNAGARPQPLAAWPRAERAAIVGVFTDIDDTLTTDGLLTPEARGALAALRDAGLVVIALTGRAVGWVADRVAGWPLDAVVAENGTVLLAARPAAGDSEPIGLQGAPVLPEQLQKWYRLGPQVRAAAQARLQAVAHEVLAALPFARLAPGADGRETDLAFDHAEQMRLTPAQTDALEAALRAHGLATTRSSIHVHGSVGASDKWLGAQWALALLAGRRLDHELAQWVAVGDSGNDEALFAHFRHSVGVANVVPWLGRLGAAPRYLTQGERGAGFAELAAALLEARVDA